MYEHAFFMVSSMPKQIASYDTIIYPFDFYVWGFTFSTIIAQFVLLLVTQNLWSHATGNLNPHDYIFQGFLNLQQPLNHDYNKFVSDFFLCTELIPKRRLICWIEREGFQTRKILIIKWLFLGNLITMAYKSTLLSSLIQIRYENTIDTLIDLENSGLPVFYTDNTPPQRKFASDPRQIMKNIYNKSIPFPFNGTVPYQLINRQA